MLLKKGNVIQLFPVRYNKKIVFAFSVKGHVMTWLTYITIQKFRVDNFYFIIYLSVFYFYFVCVCLMVNTVKQQYSYNLK